MLVCCGYSNPFLRSASCSNTDPIEILRFLGDKFRAQLRSERWENRTLHAVVVNAVDQPDIRNLVRDVVLLANEEGKLRIPETSSLHAVAKVHAPAVQPAKCPALASSADMKSANNEDDSVKSSRWCFGSRNNKSKTKSMKVQPKALPANHPAPKSQTVAADSKAVDSSEHQVTFHTEEDEVETSANPRLLFHPPLVRWSPETHRYFSRPFRRGVRTVMLIRAIRKSDMQPFHPNCGLYKLPHPVMLMVFSMLSNWW